MSEVERIIEQLERTYDGEAWYGPALRGLLADVTAAEAVARPIPAVHSIWEVTLHIAAWVGVIRTRIATGRAELPSEGDWPGAGAGDAEWRHLRAELDRRIGGLVEDLRAMSEARLEERIGRLHEVTPGAGVTVYVTLHGIVQHNVYHAGQIAMLKRALRAP